MEITRSNINVFESIRQRAETNCLEENVICFPPFAGEDVSECRKIIVDYFRLLNKRSRSKYTPCGVNQRCNLANKIRERLFDQS
jgi:hypothetical protein